MTLNSDEISAREPLVFFIIVRVGSAPAFVGRQKNCFMIGGHTLNRRHLRKFLAPDECRGASNTHNNDGDTRGLLHWLLESRHCAINTHDWDGRNYRSL